MLKYGKLSFVILVLLTFVLIYITNHYILTIGFYANSDNPLSGIPGHDAAIYETLQHWIYLSSAAYLLLKISAISLIVYIGLYLADEQVDYSDIFNVVVLAEYVFLIPAIVKIASFYYVFPQGTLQDWNQYYPFSALSLFKAAPTDWYYALQTLNVFEIGYWFILGYLVRGTCRLNFDQSLRIVVTSYLPALFVWVASVTFCILMLFPTSG